MGIFDKPGQTTNTTNAEQHTQKYPPVTQNADLCARIANAEVKKRSPFAAEGVYPVLYIDSVSVRDDRQEVPFYTVELLILESNVPARPAGTKLCWRQNIKSDVGPGSIKAFIAASMGVTPNEVDSEAAGLTLQSENPLHGRLIRMTAANWRKDGEIVITKNGEPFTICDWSPLSEEYQARSEEVLKAVFPS